MPSPTPTKPSQDGFRKVKVNKQKGNVVLALVITLVILVIFIVAAQVYVQAGATTLGNRNEPQKAGATPSLQQATQE